MRSRGFRRGGISPRGRGRGGVSSPRPMIQIDSSSSDDLPELETKQSTESVNIIEDSYSYYEESNSEEYDQYEHDWKSHKKNIQEKPRPKPQPPTPTPPPKDPNKMRRKIPQRGGATIGRRPLPSPQKQPITPASPKENQSDSNSKNSEKNSYDYSSSENEYSTKIHNSNPDSVVETDDNKERNISTDNDNNQNQEHSPPHTPNQAPSNDDDNNNSPIKSNQNQENSPPQTPSPAPLNNDNNNNNDNTPVDANQNQENNPPQTPNPEPSNTDADKNQTIKKPIQSIQSSEQSYQISYERAIALWKRPVKMTMNDILVFSCQSAYDKAKKKVHIVCSSSKAPISFTSPYYSGMIVRHQSGSRFTVFGKSEEGKHPPQLAGISFIDLEGDDSRIRYFRIAIPDKDYEYVPNENEKDKDLSNIAKAGQSLPNIKVYSSALPKKHPNGRLTLDMGPYQVKRSLKNFIIRDEDNNILFLIFKSLDGICKIKANPPFTPIVTFGLGVAILTSMK